MAQITPLNIQDPSDLDAILNDGKLSDMEVYVWQLANTPIKYRHRLGAWRVAERKKSRPDAEFWGPRSELYYYDMPDDFGTCGTLPIKPDGIWQSLPPSWGDEYVFPRKRSDESIVVTEHEESAEEALCEQCVKIPVGKLLLSERSYKLYDKASHLNVNSCRLCRLIYRHIKNSIVSQDDEISLSVKPADGILSPRLVIRTGSEQTEQASLVMLHRTGSKEYFRLLQKWLDESTTNGREISPYYLPSRLIEITLSEGRFKLRLLKTAEEFLYTSRRYVALSHRWGGINTFCTTADNLDERLIDIPFAELPKTFQHAVITTWNLGVGHLWIDSLCIIQHDESDWRRESARMENVFAYAHCTLAATSAENCNQGFLRRSPGSAIRLRDATSTPAMSVYITKTENDFDKDVAQGPLNKRAWVFQERVLSRRTIHFAAEQTYLELESNIWCETMGPEHSSESPLQKLYLRLFEEEEEEEEKEVSSSKKEDSLFEACFSQYSTLDITDCRDRPAGILGLESRLAASYKTVSLYGIILSSFYNSLFWHRSGRKRMKAIDFPDENVPSWSWMASEGAIDYGFFPGSLSGSIQFDCAKEEDEDVKLTNAGQLAPTRESGFLLIAPLYQVLGSCDIEPDENYNCKVRDGDKFLGWIRFDGEDQTDCANICCIRFGRIGTKKEDALSSGGLARGDFVPVMLVKPTNRDGRNVYKTYQRVGVGIIRDESMVRDKQGLVWVT